MAKLAIVQTPPIFLNKQQTIALATSNIEEAAKQEAKLIVFTETFIPGYPAWIWRLKAGADWNTFETLHQRLLEHAVTLDSDDLLPLYEIARKYQVTIVCGIEERDTQLSHATLYNTVITIASNGKLINRHRKLMPTNPERMVWGFGDASGLKVVQTPLGRIGALICWENFMPLTRYALYAQGIDIYIAPTYDSGKHWVGTLQHIAREGRCWVIGCGNLLQATDIPDDFPEKARLYPNPDEWINPGDSLVITPDGEIIACPMHEKSGILYCEVDPERSAIAKRTFDVAGHYARPDIFQLHINDMPQSPVQFSSKTPSH